jgi:ATPase subunit of ABC transporter with duplicated ATPase domains
LEVEGHNVLLLDEPTDKLGIDARAALEAEDAG